MKEKSKIELLSGILLIIPIYVLIFVALHILNLNSGLSSIVNELLLPLFMYLPIFLGVKLAYKTKNGKDNKGTGKAVLVFLFISLFFYFDTYFISSGWNALIPYFLWLINSIICRIISYIFYCKIVGWQRSIIFMIIYTLIIIYSTTIDFWG